MEMHLSIRADVGRAHVPFLRRYLRRAIPLLPHRLTDISLALVNDATMSDLHMRFMNLPGPTDVLTFPLDDNGSGEIVICVSEAARRGKVHGSSVRNELLLYAIHGMLHLCGMDDRTQRGFEKMHRTEDEILTRIGVGAVFRADAETCRLKPARRRRKSKGMR
jgi:rRNA maturation RNase YbeY